MYTTLIVTALIATAQTAPSDPVERIAAPVPAGSVAMTRPTYGLNTKFCVNAEVTGSRILRKTCATRTDWLDQGFDPLTAKHVR